MIEVYPKKIDVRAAQFELQRLVDAFLGVAEAELSEMQGGQSAPTQTEDSGNRMNSPLTKPLTLNSKTR